jgi:hypothetical protein
MWNLEQGTMERDLNSEGGLRTDMNRALSNNLVLVLHKTWVDHDGPAAHTLQHLYFPPLHGNSTHRSTLQARIAQETKREPSRSAEVR